MSHQEAPGIRNLQQCFPIISDFVLAGDFQRLIAPFATSYFPVRTLFFDKTPATNWKVPWHQDLTICVEKKYDVPGFTGWSKKEGVLHVQPPAEILGQMITVRLHLDDCGLENGPLRVLPGTHRYGRLSMEQIGHFRKTIAPTTCCLPEGGALIMKPLLLHSSSTAEIPWHRRVLHIELATTPLPPPLAWLNWQ
jgi:ectoine hydroxylase-related dioxygenase (phytanoyl-CoA dioxygenase family)